MLSPSRSLKETIWKPSQKFSRFRQFAPMRKNVSLLPEKQYEGIDDDSSASRIEARDKINFLTRFNRKIARAEPGRTVDLRRTIVDYGYDPEEAAADQSCGLAYVSEADRKETDYHSNVGTVSGL